jgi:CheY-like chemotaxis protein
MTGNATSYIRPGRFSALRLRRSPGTQHLETPYESSKSMSDVNIARPRVVVADPDPETSALLARQLEWAGYDVTTAFNGRDALDVIGRMRPAAVVLEVTMEVLNGYEVVRHMREDPRSQLTPVVMISARAGKLDRDFAFTVGADDYVKKPFRSADLVARVALLVPSPDGSKVKPVPAPSPITRPVRRPLAPVRRVAALAR